MIAYYGNPAIKAERIARVRDHAAHDRLVQGIGWENGKGCAVGCTFNAYDHSRGPVEIGFPEWLMHVEDVIFEGLPNDLAMTWPERFLDAAPVGADLDRIKPAVMLFILGEARAACPAEETDALAAIDRVIALWRRDDFGSEAFTSEAKEAARAAEEASWASWGAARSEMASWAADAAAEAATWGTEAESWAADAAAEAAAMAAEAASWGTEAESKVRAGFHIRLSEFVLSKMREATR